MLSFTPEPEKAEEAADKYFRTPFISVQKALLFLTDLTRANYR